MRQTRKTVATLLISGLLGIAVASLPASASRSSYCEKNACFTVVGNCGMTDATVNCMETETPPYCQGSQCMDE